MSLGPANLEFARKFLGDDRTYCIRGSPNYMLYARQEKEPRITFNSLSYWGTVPEEIAIAVRELQNLRFTLHIDIAESRIDTADP